MKLKLFRRSCAVTLGGGLGAAMAYAALQLVAEEGIPGLERACESVKGYREYLKLKNQDTRERAA